MNGFFQVVGTVALLLTLLWFVVPTPPAPEALRDMPWQVELFEDGGSKALGIHLGQSTLEQAAALYGEVEDISLFSPKPDGQELTLEAYFGSVRTGPLAAKLVLRLDAEPEALRAMAQRALARKPGPSGSYQWVLTQPDKESAMGKTVNSLTFIPMYDNLDAVFFRDRFGEPAAWRRHDQRGMEWYYPEQGLSILIDPEGKEVLQYARPKAFKLPQDAQSGTKAQ